MAQTRSEKIRESSREEDAETMAAIQRGISDSEEGRVTPIEDVRKSVSKWTSKSSSPAKP